MFPYSEKGGGRRPLSGGPGGLTASSPSSWSPSSPSSSPLWWSPPSGVARCIGDLHRATACRSRLARRQRCRRPRFSIAISPRHVRPRAPHSKKGGAFAPPEPV